MISRSPARRAAGFSLLELLIVLTLVGLVTVAGYPPFVRSTSGWRLRMAAQQVAGVLQTARLYAVRHGAKVAVKFRTDTDGVVTYALYRDDDGDGVRSADIDGGVDPEVWAPRRLAYLDGRIRFGLPAARPPRHPGDPNRRVDQLDDPIRFNRSDLASFDPRGTATPGSVYLIDDYGHLMAVRVFQLTGKVQVLAYDAEREVWEP